VRNHHAVEPTDRLVYAGEAAARLGVDETTLHRWCEHRMGPPTAVTSSGHLAYWSSDLEEWQDQLGERVDFDTCDTLLRHLPDGSDLFRVLRNGATSRTRFEVRRGRDVLARFASVAGVYGYVLTVRP
jgi:hypothetical protein